MEYNTGLNDFIVLVKIDSYHSYFLNHYDMISYFSNTHDIKIIGEIIDAGDDYESYTFNENEMYKIKKNKMPDNMQFIIYINKNIINNDQYESMSDYVSNYCTARVPNHFNISKSQVFQNVKYDGYVYDPLVEDF
jgi:hypothetical protein